ncbi:response regulator [Planctomycetales bacterium ZRK34]|nr:response regulator [Planctomycetales bacterium ZRK34]
MSKPVILCVDDQREVLAALTKDLEPLTSHFSLVDAESADEAIDVLDDLEAGGTPIALIISDHVMPGVSGVDFLSKIAAQSRFAKTRKLLLTGLATHEDTIRAINEGHIDNYTAKPWQPGTLLATVKKLISEYVFDALPDAYLDYKGVMDPDVMINRLQRRGGP